MKDYGRQKPYTLLNFVAFSSTPYTLCKVHYLHRTIMHTGSCTHQFRVYSAGFKFKLIQGPRRVIKSSKITIERALKSDKALGGNVADWSFPGQRDRPRSNRRQYYSWNLDKINTGRSMVVLQYALHHSTKYSMTQLNDALRLNPQVCSVVLGTTCHFPEVRSSPQRTMKRLSTSLNCTFSRTLRYIRYEDPLENMGSRRPATPFRLG